MLIQRAFVFREQKAPALTELLEAVKSHTLPALGACTEMDAAISRCTDDAVLSEAQLRLQEWCMSRKKNHEVAIMGNMIKSLGDQHDTRYVSLSAKTKLVFTLKKKKKMVI